MSSNRQLFLDSVPRQLQSRLLRAVFDGCISAHKASKDVHEDWVVDAMPTYRRLAVEPMLQALVLPSGFESSVKRTPSSHYTKIESDAVVITALTRNRRRSWVPPEPYRETLAGDDQLSFPWEEELKAAGTRLFALLVYGGPHRQRTPTLAYIAFPLVTGHFAPGTVDLLQEFPEIVSSYEPSIEIEPPVLNVRPAAAAKKKAGE